MKKFTVLSCLIFVFIFVFFSDSQSATIWPAAETAAERDPNAPPLEGALLSPVGAFGDTAQYVVSISDDILCGVSQGRLKTFEKDNVEDVISSYWLPYRNPRVFEYYKGYIYLVQGYDGIWIFDVSDPQEIRLAGILDIAVASNARIEIMEDKLFLVDEPDKSLVILSLVNPEEPREKSRGRLPEEVGTGSRVIIVDDRIYVLGFSGLVIFDARYLRTLEILGRIEIESQLSLGALVVKGDYAYVYAGHEIRVFDVSVPDAIEFKTSIHATWCSHAVIRGNHFIGYGMNGLYIYDISSPLSPELVREYHNQLPGDFLIGKSQDYVVDENGKAEPLNGLPYFSGVQSRFGFGATNIVIRKEYAYVLGSDRLWILDISQPWAPEYVADISIWSGGRDTVIVDGDYLYTPRQIIDISQVSEPSIIKTLGSGFYTGVAIKDNYLLTVKWEGLEIFDIRIPSETTLIKSIPFEERVNKVSVHNDIIYLGFYEGKLRSCILESDLTLKTLDQIELAATDRGLILDLCEENDFLYVALNGDGIASVDIEDPYDMQVYARFNTSQYSEQVEVFNAYAYAADGSGGILVIDMLTKGFEKEIASYPTTDWTRAIAISDGYVYTGESDNGIAIFASDLFNVK
jgi:hypothetical protein